MAKSRNGNDLISQADAAQLRGVSRASISELIKRGRLTVVEIAGKKLLNKCEVLNFVPQKGGRPAKQTKTAAKRVPNRRAKSAR